MRTADNCIFLELVTLQGISIMMLALVIRFVVSVIIRNLRTLRMMINFYFFMHNFKMLKTKSFFTALKDAIYNRESVAQVLIDYIPWLGWIYEIYWKIKDYDRLQEDYERVLGHATGGRWSKSTYDPDIMMKEIDDAQHRIIGSMFKDDLLDIINTTKGMERIELLRDYLDKIDTD